MKDSDVLGILEEPRWFGPPIDDFDVFKRLPDALQSLLLAGNGCVLFGGGFHLRGACHQPSWHSLRTVWLGARALHQVYAALVAEDIPFAQDVTGDQFVLRDAMVYRLWAETGELDALDIDFRSFIHQVSENPIDTLLLQPLLEFRANGGTLAPGQLLSVYPPLCTAESADGVSYAAIPAEDRLAFLADFSSQIRDVPDGGQITFR